MTNMDPDTVGPAMAVCLLSCLYALGLALFVFLPIGLRLSPTTSQLPVFLWRFSLWQLLVGVGVFYLLRCLAVLLTLMIAPDATSNPEIVFQRATFALNPADPTDNYFPFTDLPSLVLIVGSWWAFRLASGKRRRWVAAPVIILIGIFWSIQCFIFMLADIDPERVGTGFAVTMLPTLYGFIAAAGFLSAAMRRSFQYLSPSSPAEGTEQAKEIIDRAVEDVQNRKC
jgi:hypothetical protein